MATSLFDEPSMPSFSEYPTAKPFLNSDITRNTTKPANAFPESSSQAVLSALKGLQDKIRNLELDRSKAERNLKDLATETSMYKDLLSQSQKTPEKEQNGSSLKYRSAAEASDTNPRRADIKTTGIESQLRNADARCRLLERQLDNMRKMVQVAEKERGDALERQISLERERGRITAENRDTVARLSKLEQLQSRFDDLATRKYHSEAKVRELEEKLQFEEHQKKLMSDRAAQLSSEARAQAILLKDEIPERDNVPVKSAKAKKKQSKRKTKPIAAKQSVHQPTVKPANRVPQLMASQPHYRLNLADVPFITGTSTSPSHAVSANMQTLLHDLKQHNPIYCNNRVIYDDNRSSSDDVEEDIELVRGRSKVTKNRASPSSSERDLSDLLVALQDEFGKLTFDHQVLTRRLSETHDKEFAKDLRKELDGLEQKMEMKGDQIVTVRRHRASLEEARRRKAGKSKKAAQATSKRPSSFPRRQKSRGGAGNQSTSMSPGSRAGMMRKRRLDLLRDVRAVHSALRKDDISWD